jgi:rhamnose utilization protein RhaD (predicted bifunctional aldolase and dehydrogenase)
MRYARTSSGRTAKGSGVQAKRAKIMKSTSMPSEIDCLLSLSARIGRDRLLTQASNGNTSIKLDRILWIKASAKWLSNALQEDILVPVDLALAKNCLRQNKDLRSVQANSERNLRPSIETAMHLVLGHRVVVHVHSVNSIALGIRSDARQHLRRRLDGLRWEFLPYVPSGLPLAEAVERVVRDSPCTDVIVLGNHGLIVCGRHCDSVEELLDEVERRLALNPRRAPDFDSDFLLRLGREGSGWRLPEHTALHALATDAISRRILSGGVLYPCQAIFLGGSDPWKCFYPGLYSEAAKKLKCQSEGQPFAILEGRGVLISDNITSAELETLLGLVEVVQRVDDAASIRYLTSGELQAVSKLGGYRLTSASFERPALSA